MLPRATENAVVGPWPAIGPQCFISWFHSTLLICFAMAFSGPRWSPL